MELSKCVPPLFCWQQNRLREQFKGDETELNKNFFDQLLEEIRQIVRQEIAAAWNSNVMNNDKLLTVNEAAALINVQARWLYRHAAKLPFTRRINRKNLRFSEAGIRRWLATKKPSSNR